MKSIKIQIGERIEDLVYELNQRLGKFVEVSSKKQDGDFDAEVDEEIEEEEHYTEEHEKHDGEQEETAAGDVVENGNN